MDRKKMKFVIAGVVVAAAIGSLIFFGVQENMVYYRTVSELKEEGPTGDIVKVSGQLVPGTVEQEGIGDTLEFQIRDMEKQDEEIHVVFTGSVPDAFRDEPGVEVVVDGEYLASGSFEAYEMLAKCPSKYESAAAEEEGTAASE